MSIIVARGVPYEVLKKCFSPAEWEWLLREPSFVQKADSLRDMNDVESISRVGLSLITDAERGTHSGKRIPPGADVDS
jgi:hypothetical protein